MKKNGHHFHRWRDFNGKNNSYPRHHIVRSPDKERFLFRRFFGIFMSGLFLILVGVILATIVLQELSGRTLVIILVGTFLVIMILGTLPFIAREVKRITKPIAEVMSAADSVAEGDFSIRITEDYAGEFKKLAESFNRMIKRLEEADDRRRRLTADVAHELRTPLHILQGNLEGMQDGIYPMDEPQLKILLDETKTLSRLVDDLQTLTLAENEQLLLHYDDIAVKALLSEVVNGFSSQAESLRISLSFQPPAEVLIVHIDKDRIKQVLDNLIANALRYTPAGGQIRVIAEKKEETVLIRISDTGHGISEEDLPYVFDRFWKGDSSRIHRDGSGSGLGLAIAKSIIEMHHGVINVESKLGQGTTFTIQLPLLS